MEKNQTNSNKPQPHVFDENFGAIDDTEERDLSEMTDHELVDAIFPEQDDEGSDIIPDDVDGEPTEDEDFFS